MKFATKIVRRYPSTLRHVAALPWDIKNSIFCKYSDVEENANKLHFKYTGFYRASICEGGLGSRNFVCPSVCPSVCLSHAWIVTKLNDALQIFYTTRKGNHSATLTPRLVGGRCPLPSEICVQSDPPPSKNADFDRFPLMTSQP